MFFFFCLPPVFPYPACLAFCRGGAGGGGGGCRRGIRGWDSLVGWPAVCQLCASGTLSGVEKGLLSPTCTHSLSRLSHPKPWPCEIRQTDSAKTITPPYTCMWPPPAHTHSCPHTLILSAVRGLIFPSLPLSLHTDVQEGPRASMPSSMCHCF